MSKADDMFEKLGYKIENMTDKDGHIWGISYKNDGEYYDIDFDLYDKTICVGSQGNFEAVYFTMQDLEAINEKVKELGWLDR